MHLGFRVYYGSCCTHCLLSWPALSQHYSLGDAGSVWSLKSNGPTWSGCNRCATGRSCTSNSCSDGVKKTRLEKWRCPAVQSSIQSLGTSIHRMHTSSSCQCEALFLLIRSGFVRLAVVHNIIMIVASRFSFRTSHWQTKLAGSDLHPDSNLRTPTSDYMSAYSRLTQ